MSHRLRLAFLLPLSLLFAVVLFVLPDFALGIPGGLAVVVCAWVVWISTWVSLLRVQPGDMIGAVLDGSSPGEQCAWVGAAFSAMILAYTIIWAPAMVVTNGGISPEATVIAKRIGTLVVLWMLAMHLLRKRWHDKVEADERDRVIAARGERWARMALSVFAISLAVTLAFTPAARLDWATPIMLASMLVMAVIGAALVEHVVVAAGYWRDRH